MPMDGIEKITRQIIAEAEAECNAITAEAAAKCAEIKADFDKKADELYDAAMQTGIAEIETDAKHIERNAHLNARKDILAAKQNMVDKAFMLAGKKLREIDEDKYIAWLAGIAADAAVNGDEEIVLDEAEAAVADKLVAEANAVLTEKGKKAELKLGAPAKEIGAGFILRRGDVAVNCTVAEMLSMSRKEIASDVAAKLFG